MKTHRLIVFLLFNMIVSPLTTCPLLSQDRPYFWPARFQFLAGDDPEDIAIGDFNEDGRQDLVAADKQGGQIAILIGEGNGFFSDPTFHVVGEGPVAVLVGDFDEDAHQDIAVASEQGGNIGIFLGSGTGGFSEPSYIDLPGGPSALALRDFDQDGHQDLAVAIRNNNRVAILLGDGNGSFAGGGLFHTGDQPVSIAVDDFNEDSHQDLAVANMSSDNVAILHGAGDGTFSNPVFLEVGDEPRSVVSGDFDGNGHSDLAVANESNAGTAILLGTGNGEFSNPTFFAQEVYGTDVAVGDFNEDGNEDLAVTNLDSSDVDHNVTIMTGNGDGSFSVPSFYPTASTPKAVVVGDLNNDGDQDLVVASMRSLNDPYYHGLGAVSILLGSGDGTFPHPYSVTAGYNTSRAIVGDFDEDGHLDLAMTNYGFGTAFGHEGGGVMIFLGTGTGSLYYVDGWGLYSPSQIASGDFNEDGHLDLAVGEPTGGYYGENPGVYIRTGNGDGTFENFAYNRIGMTGLLVDDFDEDGHQDMAVLEGRSVVIYHGDGMGDFSRGNFQMVGEYPIDMIADDFNGDGHSDLAVTLSGNSGNTDNVAILIGDGHGNFSHNISYPLENVRSIKTGDFDEDGNQDLAVHDDGISIFFGRGDGYFSDPLVIDIVGGSIIAGYFNGDGHQDFAISSSNRDQVTILPGNGDGTFSNPSNYGIANFSGFLTSGDFNEDERSDLVSLNDDPTDYYEDLGGITILLRNSQTIDVDLESAQRVVFAGDTLSLASRVANDSDSLITFDISLTARIIGQNELTIFGPMRLSLEAGQELERAALFPVPEDAPPKAYVLSLRAEALTGEGLDFDYVPLKVRVRPGERWPENNGD